MVGGEKFSQFGYKKEVRNVTKQKSLSLFLLDDGALVAHDHKNFSALII